MDLIQQEVRKGFSADPRRWGYRHPSCRRGAAAGAADDDIGFDVVLIQSRCGLQTDDRLMQQHLIQHAAQHIAVT